MKREKELCIKPHLLCARRHSDTLQERQEDDVIAVWVWSPAACVHIVIRGHSDESHELCH